MPENQSKIMNLSAEDIFAVKPIIANPEKLEAEFNFGGEAELTESLLIDEKIIESINARARKTEMVKFYFGIGYFVLFLAALIALFL